MGVGKITPDARIHVFSGKDVSLTLDGYIMMGPKNGINLI